MSAQAKETSAATEASEKLVTVFIPMTKDDTENVYISVNNRDWSVPRGKEVKLPACAAEVLRRSQEAEMKAFKKAAKN